MKIIKTSISGLVLIELKVYNDSRGYLNPTIKINLIFKLQRLILFKTMSQNLEKVF